MRIEYYQKPNIINFTGTPIKPAYSAKINKAISAQLGDVIKYSKELFGNISTSGSENLRLWGIKETPKSMSDGITFLSEKYNYILSVHENNAVRLRLQNPKIENSIFVQDGQIARTDTTADKLPERIEFFKFRANILEKEAMLKTGLDEIDYTLLKIRKAVKTGELSAYEILLNANHPDIILPTAIAKTKKQVQPKPVTVKKPKIKRTQLPKTVKVKEPNGKLNESTEQLVREITSEFNRVHELLKSVKNCKTRNLIKNGFPTIQNGIAGSKILDFSVKHPYLKKISVNMINDHYKKNLVITTKEFMGADKIIVITPENEVFKTIPMGILRDSNVREGKPQLEFFTQEEIDGKDFDTPLTVLRDNLVKYREYVSAKVNELNGFKAYHSTSEAGSTEKFAPKIKSIYRNLKFFTKNIGKYSDDSNIRRRFKKQNDIEVLNYQGKPVKIYLKEITPDRKSVFIKFGKTDGKDTVQILVHKGDDIEKTYQIYDNKLLKFEAKSIGMRPHYDRNIYYFTQEEIHNSGLEEILSLIESHIKRVNGKIRENITN